MFIMVLNVIFIYLNGYNIFQCLIKQVTEVIIVLVTFMSNVTMILKLEKYINLVDM